MIKKSKIDINGIAVSILEAGSGDKTIFFVHGNSSSAFSWVSQLEDSNLASQYHLVAIDLPGHGDSDKAQDYHLASLSKTLNSIINSFRSTSYILVGLSYGTCLIGEVAQNLEKSCKGILLASANLTNNEFNPGVYLNPFPEMIAMTSGIADKNQAVAFANKLVYNNLKVQDDYVNSYMQTDPAFRIALGEDVGNAAWTDEFANVIGLKIPVCVIFGEKELAIKTNYLDNFPSLWQKRVIHLKDAGHFVNMEQPECFNNILSQFVADVLK